MTSLHARVFNQAQSSSTPTQAAIHIILTAVNGTLVDKLTPAIDDDPDLGRAWIDWDHALELSQPFSGGERRLINIAASLASTHEVNLADALTGLDVYNGRLVAEALCHAMFIRAVFP